MLDENDTEDLDALAEHVNHLQNRINRLKHFYGGNHDQKTHGRRKGSGTGGSTNASRASAAVRRQRGKDKGKGFLTRGLPGFGGGKKKAAFPGVFTKAGRGSIVSETRAALAKIKRRRSGAKAGNAQNRKLALAAIKKVKRQRKSNRRNRGALSRLISSVRGIGIGTSRVVRGKRN